MSSQLAWAHSIIISHDTIIIADATRECTYQQLRAGTADHASDLVHPVSRYTLIEKETEHHDNNNITVLA